MVQRFCLVSLTISNRKTSHRLLKQTAGSTSCPWTTILVIAKSLRGLFINVCHTEQNRTETLLTLRSIQTYEDMNKYIR